MTLNGVMAVTLRYFTEVGKPALQKTICGGIYARVYCILVRVQCHRKESSHSLSHLLMSFLSIIVSIQKHLRTSFVIHEVRKHGQNTSASVHDISTLVQYISYPIFTSTKSLFVVRPSQRLGSAYVIHFSNL